ncbi:hypothetical protein [Salipaludibacillus agaradhaerens]|uniref:hypothetical protein n=1 Tax=Salipaludibacillus agaradhaerens TaxID=76935 RepID=UPI000996F03E|nr:hypothetical protein [Salipaludibacillus agaradhaerens]
MKKRLVTVLIIGLIILLGYAVFFFVTLKSDEDQIRDEVRSVYGEASIIEIKMLDGGSDAIVIFEWRSRNVGVMTLSKSWFEWDMVESSSERFPRSMTRGVFYREFDQYTVLTGYVGGETSDIKVYFKEEPDGLLATIKEDNIVGRTWYLITENDNLSDVVMKAYDEEGNVIAEMDESVFNGARLDLNN